MVCMERHSARDLVACVMSCIFTNIPVVTLDYEDQHDVRVYCVCLLFCMRFTYAMMFQVGLCDVKKWSECCSDRLEQDETAGTLR